MRILKSISSAAGTLKIGALAFTECIIFVIIIKQADQGLANRQIPEFLDLGLVNGMSEIVF